MKSATIYETAKVHVPPEQLSTAVVQDLIDLCGGHENSRIWCELVDRNIRCEVVFHVAQFPSAAILEHKYGTNVEASCWEANTYTKAEYSREQAHQEMLAWIVDTLDSMALDPDNEPAAMVLWAERRYNII